MSSLAFPTRRQPRAWTSTRAAAVVLFLSAATIAGAWAFQYAGYLPCDLCLKQRWAYYVGVPLAAVVLGFVKTAPRGLVEAAFWLMALLWLGSAVFGAYHSGVEWGIFQGPTDCTGTLTKAASMNDFMQQLQTTKVVRCDAVAIRILGLSLAGWNCVVSLILAAVSIAGARHAGRAGPPTFQA